MDFSEKIKKCIMPYDELDLADNIERANNDITNMKKTLGNIVYDMHKNNVPLPELLSELLLRLDKANDFYNEKVNELEELRRLRHNCK